MITQLRGALDELGRAIQEQEREIARLQQENAQFGELRTLIAAQAAPSDGAQDEVATQESRWISRDGTGNGTRRAERVPAAGLTRLCRRDAAAHGMRLCPTPTLTGTLEATPVVGRPLDHSRGGASHRRRAEAAGPGCWLALQADDPWTEPEPY